jgi:transcriptional regulator with GAF, ATPase, and Fis domain
VRVIAASNRDLRQAVEQGKFREDLFYRLQVFDIPLPPLRERSSDVPPLAEQFLEELGQSMGRPVARLGDDAREAMLSYSWPGNVRELRNVLDRAVYLARATGHGELNLVSLPMSGVGVDDVFQFEPGKSYRETRAKFDADFERRYVKWLLARHAGNVSAAARDAKMDRKHLHDMAKKHGLRGPEQDEE